MINNWVERFWSRVKRGDGCWEWQGGSNQYGYGLFTRRGCDTKVTRVASRISWELAHGPIPQGMVVCHKCDNPPCVNPDHLFIGTHLDNMRDMVAKGRSVPSRKSWTHCTRGHEFTPENTRIHKDGYRLCRECVRITRQVRYWRNKARRQQVAA